ncbi:hypothetical protein LINGRAPRIM_LOCUS3266 [Linum grandiflorum]
MTGGSREYKVWTKHEEATLVKCMRELVEKTIVQNGNFKLSGLKELERMMHIKTGNYNLLATHIKSKVRYFKDKFTALLELQLASGFGWDATRGCIVADAEIFHGWVLGHPKAKGLNNKPLPYLDDFYVIFGEDHALGVDAVQPSDAASKMQSAMSASNTDEGTERADSYTIPPELDHDAVMEDIINQGIDLDATGLKEVEAEITSKQVQRKGKEVATSSGSKRGRMQFSEDERTRMVANLTITTKNIAKIATNYCIEGDLAVKRQHLYAELAKFTTLNVSERTRAMRHLNRDDGDAATFFQFPTEEEKLEFVWTILE